MNAHYSSTFKLIYWKKYYISIVRRVNEISLNLLLWPLLLLLYVWDEQKLSKSIILRSEIWKKIFSGICKSKSLKSKSEKSYLKIQLKPKGFFHNYNRGVNRLLNNKVQISLLFKKKIGILTVILPEEIDFNFGVFV